MTSQDTAHQAQGEWHVLDARDEVVGRLATKAATLLLGKHRADSRTHTIAPVYVVITNSDQAKFSGNKEHDKKYYRHSGYPGGLKTRTVADQRTRDSRVIIRRAVEGMLPKNKIRPERMRHLKIYTSGNHPHLPQTTGNYTPDTNS